MSKQDDIRSAYQEFFSTPSGLMVLDDLMNITRPNQSVFHQDLLLNAMNQGKQAIGFHILNQLKEKEHDRTSRNSKPDTGTSTSTRRSRITR